MSVRVIGMGSELRGDDGAGVAVAKRLREEAGAAIDVRISSGESVGLIEAWAGAEDVIIVDAFHTGGEPGTIHRFEMRGPLPGTPAPSGSHDAGLAEAVALAHSLGRLPEQLVVYGIEGACFDVGAPLSPTVRRAVETVCAHILEHALRGTPEQPGQPADLRQ
jgi:hydrogenase maturation protease